MNKDVGLLLITYNDSKNLQKMLESFEKTVDFPVDIFHIDLGSTDNSRNIISYYNKHKENPFVKSIDSINWGSRGSLTEVMNHGFKGIIASEDCEYVGWIHPDMEFKKEQWLSELVAVLEYHPEIGKVCSYNIRDGRPDTEYFIEGQEQCFIMKQGILLKIGLFDERFIGIGGYEDWDMNNRIKQEGLKVVIDPKSQVFHKGMATRERRDTSKEQHHNSEIYFRKWGTFKE